MDGGAGRSSRARAGARTSLLDVLRDQFPNATTDDLVFALGLGSYVTATKYLEGKYLKATVAVRTNEPIATGAAIAAATTLGAPVVSAVVDASLQQPVPLSAMLSRTRKRHGAVTATSGGARIDVAHELRKEFPSATQSEMIRAIGLGSTAVAREYLQGIYPSAAVPGSGGSLEGQQSALRREGGATPVPSSPTVEAVQAPSTQQHRPVTPQARESVVTPSKLHPLEVQPDEGSGRAAAQEAQMMVPHRTRRSTTIRLIKVPVVMPSSAAAHRDEKRAGAVAVAPSRSTGGEGELSSPQQHESSSSHPAKPPPKSPGRGALGDEALSSMAGGEDGGEMVTVTKTIVVLDPVTEELEQDALLCGISRGPFLLVAMVIAFCIIGGSITGLILSATIVSFPHRQACVACLTGQSGPAVWNYSTNLCVSAPSAALATCDATTEDDYCLDQVLFCGAPECRSEQITQGVRLTPYWAVCLVSLISVTIATAYNILHRFYLRPWFELVTSWWSHSSFVHSMCCCGCWRSDGEVGVDGETDCLDDGGGVTMATGNVKVLLPPRATESGGPKLTEDTFQVAVQPQEPIYTTTKILESGDGNAAHHTGPSPIECEKATRPTVVESDGYLYHHHDDDDDDDHMSESMSSIMNLSFLNGLTDDRDINDLDLLFSFFGTEAAFFLFILLLTNAYFVYLCVTVGNPSRAATSAGGSLLPTTADSWARYQSLFVTWLSSGTIANVLITVCNFPAYWYARKLLNVEGAYLDPVHLLFLEGKVRSIIFPRVKYLGTEWLLPVLTSVMLALWTPIIPIVVTHTIPAFFVYFPVTLAVALVWALIYWVVIRPTSKNKLVWAASLGFLRLAGTFTCICYVQTMTNYMVLFYRGDSWHSVFAQEAQYRSSRCYSNGLINSVSNSVIFLLRNFLS